jgi:hypothetical protein
MYQPTGMFDAPLLNVDYVIMREYIRPDEGAAVYTRFDDGVKSWVYSPDVSRMNYLVRYFEFCVSFLARMILREQLFEIPKIYNDETSGEKDCFAVDCHLSHLRYHVQAHVKRPVLWPDKTKELHRLLPFHVGYLKKILDDRPRGANVFSGFTRLSPFNFPNFCNSCMPDLFELQIDSILIESFASYQKTGHNRDYRGGKWPEPDRFDDGYYWYYIANVFLRDNPGYEDNLFDRVKFVNYTILKEIYILMETRITSYPTWCDWVVDKHDPVVDNRLLLLQDSDGLEAEIALFHICASAAEETERNTFFDWLPPDILHQQLNIAGTTNNAIIRASRSFIFG